MSRGGDDDTENVEIRQPARSRGRLEVIEDRRLPLQRFEEDETQFDQFSRGRQRNRG